MREIIVIYAPSNSTAFSQNVRRKFIVTVPYAGVSQFRFNGVCLSLRRDPNSPNLKVVPMPSVSSV